MLVARGSDRCALIEFRLGAGIRRASDCADCTCWSARGDGDREHSVEREFDDGPPAGDDGADDDDDDDDDDDADEPEGEAELRCSGRSWSNELASSADCCCCAVGVDLLLQEKSSGAEPAAPALACC